MYARGAGAVWRGVGRGVARCGTVWRGVARYGAVWRGVGQWWVGRWVVAAALVVRMRGRAGSVCGARVRCVCAPRNTGCPLSSPARNRARLRVGIGTRPPRVGGWARCCLWMCATCVCICCGKLRARWRCVMVCGDSPPVASVAFKRKARFSSWPPTSRTAHSSTGLVVDANVAREPGFNFLKLTLRRIRGPDWASQPRPGG